FDDKVVLVTGAASGIGRATALRIAGEGGKILAVDVQEAALQETVQLIQTAGGAAVVKLCNVTSETEVSDCMQSCIDAYGSLDVLCNIAGILRFDHFHELDYAAWRQVIDVNLNGVFLMCRAAIPHLLERKGNIVNAASTAAMAGLPWGSVYSASKGAVLALTRTLAIEYAKQGLRANCVSPGDITTPMTKAPKLPKDADWKMMARCSAINGPMGPEVIAGVVAMLASDDGVHINGENIRVDGATLS
ncbi:MAG: SDR family NAD(P)-dependent oxidoreductase, partial [Pseudomonadales bacterium]